MDSAYAEVIKWKRNTFIVPFGNDGGHFVAELARLIGLPSDGSAARAFASLAVVVAGHLLFQRPFSTSSVTDNKEFLCKRLTMWKSGDLTALLREARCIQVHLPLAAHKRTQSRAELDGIEFAKIVYGERIGTATHYLEDNGGGCVLPLDQEINRRSVLDVLRDKHPDPADSDESDLLDDELIVPESVLYEGITSARIRKSCMAMKSAAGHWSLWP